MIGTRLADRYELIGELGKGGMAVVYRARDPRLDREVAIKMISTEGLDEATVERFQREAQTVAGLDHPAIVPIYDFGRHREPSGRGSWLFFVMPVLAGRTLHRLLRERRLPLVEILEVIAQVAEALDYSASRGVVHRDVKPENVMVAIEGDQASRVWVMDFGLALARAASRLTKTGNLPGTLSYLSPEQVLSEDLDGRSDLYSLATILYECLTGKPPFSGPPASVLYRIVHEQPAMLSGKGVDGRLASIVMACLAKEPDDRPESGRHLAEVLRAHARELRLGGEGSPKLPARAAAANPIPRRRLIGRGAEIGELRRRLDSALAGECQMVLLCGERGMGKTRLLQELEADALDRRVIVLHGRFSSREAGYAYEAFGELVQDFFRPRQTPASSSGISRPSNVGIRGSVPDLADLAPDLLSLFPALGEIPEVCGAALGRGGESGTPPMAEREDPQRFYEVIARTLTRLAGGRPLVLLLEQLHWATTSVALLQYLVRRLGPTPTLIVCTFRQSAVGKRHPVRRLAGSLRGEPQCAVVELEPLDQASHRELLVELMAGAEPSDALAEKLYQASEGNPFFTEELVRSLTGAGELHESGTGEWTLSDESHLSAELPDTIQQAVETRLERLSDGLQSILGIASVLGRRFEMGDLEAAVDEDTDPDEAVDTLIAQGLLVEDRRLRGDWLVFSSALVREVVYSRLPRRRRRRLHRRYAESLEQRFADRPERVLAQLVHHFYEGDVPERTIHYGYLLARQSLDAYCWEDAVQASRTALEFMEEDVATPLQEGELRLILARALAGDGSVEMALKEAGRAMRSFELAGDDERAADACRILAETAWKNRRLDDMERWLEEGLEVARRGAERKTLADLLTLASTAANLRGEYAKARRYVEEARGLRRPDQPIEEIELEGGRVLRIGFVGSLGSLDPAHCNSPQESELMTNLFEPLLDVDGEGKFVPRLCRTIASSEDRRVFTFQLRRNLLFSDGTAVDAERVKESLEAAARSSRGRLEGSFEPISGGREFLEGRSEEIEGIRVVGPLDFEIHLHTPLAIFPAFLSSVQLCLTLRRNGRVLGTAPFVLEDGAAGSDRLVLGRNPNSRHEVLPLVSGLEMRQLRDSRTAAEAVRAGEVDLVRDLSPPDIEGFLRSGRFGSSVYEMTMPNIAFLLLGSRGPRTRDRRLRRVLCGVIDNRELVWRSLARFALPASSWIPPGVSGHDSEPQRPRPIDRFEAIEAMQDLLPLPVRLRALVHPVFADQYRLITESILSEWSLLGIDVEVEEASKVTAQEHALEEYDLLFSRWLPDYLDPDAYCKPAFHSRSGTFGPLVGSAELDALIEQARGETRTLERERLYRRIQRLLVHEHLVLPLFHDVEYRVTSPRLGGVRLDSKPPFVDYRRIGWMPEGQLREARPGALRTGRLRVALPDRIEDLDPARSIFGGANQVASLVFETLARVDGNAGVVPHLAESIVSEEAGRRYRFGLQDARFHDGRKLSPRDVRFSFQRLLRAAESGAESALMQIEGALPFHVGQTAELAGFSIVSDRELVLTLERPSTYFPALLTDASTAIVAEGTRHFDGTWREGCVGTGPFCLVSFEAGEKVELAANPDYWRSELPKCERLLFDLGIPVGRIAADFQSGHYHLAGHLKAEDLERLSRDPDYAAGLIEHPAFSTHFLVFNRLMGPLADPVRRRALRYHLARSARQHLEKLGRTGAEPWGFLPPGLLVRDAPMPPPAEPDEVDLGGLCLEAAVHPCFLEQHGAFWAALLRDLATLGVEVRVRHESIDAMLSAAARRSVDLVATRWIASAPDPTCFVNLLHCDQGLFGRLLCQERVDRLVERGRSEADPTTRHGLYRELERVLDRESLVLPLFHEQVCWLGGSGLRGLDLGYGWPEVTYEELWLDR